MSEIRVPELGDSITEGTVGKWFKQVGEAVQVGDVLLELETDKVNLEVSAEQAGVLKQIHLNEGDTVTIGDVLGMIEEGTVSPQATEDTIIEDQKVPQAPESKSQSPEPEKAEPNQPDTSKADEQQPSSAAQPFDKNERNESLRMLSPSARRQARTQGNGLQSSSGSPSTAASASQAKKEVQSYKDPERAVERIRMSRRRQTIAARLVEAQHNAAMLTTFNEVDMTAIMDVRKRRKQSFKEKHDVNLGFMSFFSKAVVGALKQFPLLNAEVDGTDIIIKKHYDIGIAVSAKEGLVVPVVRGVDRMGFAEIEREIAELADKARSNTLALSDLQGGTFTITNGGVFGSLLSTPILNAPQVGILGMHTIKLRPVAIDEKRSENRPMMYIALSYDHRIVDGSDAVQFLVAVKERLEDPETLLLEG